jgi:hypothetical protein
MAADQARTTKRWGAAGAETWTRVVATVLGLGLSWAGAVAEGTNAAVPAAVVARSGVGDELFTNAPIRLLKITIPPEGVQSLRQDGRAYVRATVQEGTRAFSDVGVHLKGAAGSSRPIDDKPALTLNFSKFNPGQTFHGLRKIHLNNSVQDPSYLCELLCGELFLAAGVPAPRATHALVELNGRRLGLFVLKEAFNQEFLSRHFKNAGGNLYDSGFIQDVGDSLERDSGNGPADWADLKALQAAAEEPDPARRWQRLQEVLDVDRFLSFLALEVMTWHWDGYAMNRNNYRIYHDPTTGKLVFLPHGMDQMFWQPDGPILPRMQGLVARSILRTPEGRRQYRERFGLLFTNVFKVPVLTARLQQTANAIRPALTLYERFSVRGFSLQSARLQQAIAQRGAFLARVLAAPPAVTGTNHAARFRPGVWQPQSETASARHERVQSSDGRPVLKLSASGPTIGSWRARLELPAGEYRFEGRVQTSGLSPLRDERGAGAGLRISGDAERRGNELSGDAGWTKLGYDFEVEPPGGAVVLVCEMRAVAGAAEFDLASLAVVRRPPP